MSDEEKESVRLELLSAAANYSLMIANEADDDRMVSVIARLENAAKVFADSQLVKDRDEWKQIAGELADALKAVGFYDDSKTLENFMAKQKPAR